MAGVLTTSGGPHPADKWALHTAEEIFDISKMDPGRDRTMLAKRTQLKIADALTPFYERVQTDERAALAANEDHSATSLGILDELITAAIQAVIGVLANTPWASMFEPGSAAAEALANVLRYHGTTAQTIDRRWHAHRTGNAAALAHLAAHEPDNHAVAGIARGA